MKKLIALIGFTGLLSLGALAHNGEQKLPVDQSPVEGKGFRLNSDFLSIFNIFNFSTAEPDSAITREKEKAPVTPVVPKLTEAK